MVEAEDGPGCGGIWLEIGGRDAEIGTGLELELGLGLGVKLKLWRKLKWLRFNLLKFLM